MAVSETIGMGETPIVERLTGDAAEVEAPATRLETSGPSGSETATAASPEPKPAPTSDPGLETWTVPLAEIEAESSPFRFRRAIKPDQKIRNLAESIDEEGLIHPLVVRKVGGAFQLVSGFRRHAALQWLARRDGIDPAAFPVKVSVLPEGATDDNALQVAFAENLARRNMDATDKAIAVLKLRDSFGKTSDEIAALVRISTRQMQRLLGLLAAPPEVREAFREGRFGLKHALALAGIDDPAVRERHLRASNVMRLRLRGNVAEGAPDSPPEEAIKERVPEAVRPFVRLSQTSDPEFPHRVTVRLKTDEAVDRLLRYLVRFA